MNAANLQIDNDGRTASRRYSFRNLSISKSYHYSSINLENYSLISKETSVSTAVNRKIMIDMDEKNILKRKTIRQMKFFKIFAVNRMTLEKNVQQVENWIEENFCKRWMRNTGFVYFHRARWPRNHKYQEHMFICPATFEWRIKDFLKPTFSVPKLFID